MGNFHYAHFSNRTEKLYQELRQRLFASSHPLTKRVVIVPSSAMKSWLMLQMAKDPTMGISAGIEIGFVEPTINNLFHLLSHKSQAPSTDPYEPTELELALALEQTMFSIAEAYASKTNSLSPEWLPLLQYLGVAKSETILSKRVKKRIRGMASNLAKLFRDYGLSGGEMIAEWKVGKAGWQALLWQKMEIIFSTWNYPAKKLDLFQIDLSFEPQDVQVHVFGLSFLAPLYHRFLGKIAARLPVHYYLLSPCQKFWGDALSDKESTRLKKFWEKQGANQGSLEALDDFLRDRNPLLANYGRPGREMAAQMESMDAQSGGIYALSSAIEKVPAYSELDSDEIILEKSARPLTILDAIHADLALLRSVELEDKISFSSYDATVQVHAAPKKVREVQIIYDLLLTLIDKHRNDADPILPSDIFIMAPNVSDYAPYISSVFESSESRLDIQLMDLQVPSQYQVIRGFLHLLSLSSSRWEASSLLQLFEYAAFRKRQRATKEDVLIIKKWINEAGIYWGKDNHHREEMLHSDYQDKRVNEETSIGTWEYGLGMLLEGLVMIPTSGSEDSIYHPLDCIEASEADLLGIVLHLIKSFQADLKPLMNGTKLLLEDWSLYLKCLLEAYFTSSDEDDGEGFRILTTHLEVFGKASRRLSDSKFAFDTIYRYLQESLKAETSVYKESNLQAVRFSSLLPMRAVPAKVIVLMGMGDGQFPRIDQENSLNMLLQTSKADYQPDRVDFDRYVFLESILSARQYFILSYVSQTPGDAKAQSPSLLVKELLSYLDHSYVVEQSTQALSELCFYNHPLIPFHHAYFSNADRFKSYSSQNYLAAQAYYHPERLPQQSFLSDFKPISDKQVLAEEVTILLKDLMAFSKNPLKVFLNHALGIYLDREADRFVKDDEDLFLSDLNASIITKQGLFGSKEATINQAEKTGKMPYGPFKVIGTERVERDIERLSDNLNMCAIDKHSLFSIQFMEHYSEPNIVEFENVWKLPPVMLQLPEIGVVKVVGAIENVSKKGLVLLCEDKLNQILESWPTCLLLNYLIEKYSLGIIPQMVFVKGKTAKYKSFKTNQLQKSAEASLVEYLEYYLGTKSGPSPLMPDWVPTILSGDQEELSSLLKEDDIDEFNPKYDQYLNWLERNSSNAEIASTSDHWQEMAELLFIDIFAEGKTKTTGLGKNWVISTESGGNNDFV